MQGRYGVEPWGADPPDPIHGAKPFGHNEYTRMAFMLTPEIYDPKWQTILNDQSREFRQLRERVSKEEQKAHQQRLKVNTAQARVTETLLKPNVAPNQHVQPRGLPPVFRHQLDSFRRLGESGIPKTVYDWYLYKHAEQNPRGIPGYDQPSFLRELLFSDAQKTLEERQREEANPEWVMERKLGAGGFGSVELWKRNIAGSSVYVAVKTSEVSYFFKDYHHEALIMARLNQAGCRMVPEVYDYTLVRPKARGEEARYRTAYEFCPHGDLRQLSKYYVDRRQDLPEPFLWHVFHSMAVVLTYCQQGTLDKEPRKKWEPISHYDLKPENIFLSDPDRSVNKHYPTIKVGDWGLAYYEPGGRLARDFRAFKAGTGWIESGTLGFLAPEARMIAAGEKIPTGHHAYGQAKDMWTVGQTILRMIKGNDKPFVYSTRLKDLVLLTLIDEPSLRIKPYQLYEYTKLVTEKFREYMDRVSSRLEIHVPTAWKVIDPNIPAGLFGANSLEEYPGRLMFEMKYRKQKLMFGRLSTKQISIQIPQFPPQFQLMLDDLHAPLMQRKLHPKTPPPLFPDAPISPIERRPSVDFSPSFPPPGPTLPATTFQQILKGTDRLAPGALPTVPSPPKKFAGSPQPVLRVVNPDPGSSPVVPAAHQQNQQPGAADPKPSPLQRHGAIADRNRPPIAKPGSGGAAAAGAPNLVRQPRVKPVRRRRPPPEELRFRLGRELSGSDAEDFSPDDENGEKDTLERMETGLSADKLVAVADKLNESLRAANQEPKHPIDMIFHIEDETMFSMDLQTRMLRFENVERLRQQQQEEKRRGPAAPAANNTKELAAPIQQQLSRYFFGASFFGKLYSGIKEAVTGEKAEEEEMRPATETRPDSPTAAEDALRGTFVIADPNDSANLDTAERPGMQRIAEEDGEGAANSKAGTKRKRDDSFVTAQLFALTDAERNEWRRNVRRRTSDSVEREVMWNFDGQ